MKKIWPWLLALLLLIIFCVWTKKDSIHITSNSPETITLQPVVSSPKHYINYEIVQHENNYVLHGNFTNIEQQNRLKDTSAATSSNLQIENTSTNQSLLGDEAITLTNNILPHFIQHYKNGKIVYSNETLRIYGDVDSYEAQHEMQRLLSASTIPSQDNSTVHIEEKPIHFLITKDENDIAFEGLFSNEAQANPIRSALPPATNIHLSNGKNLVDNGAIATTKNILSDFIATYKQGSIEYKDEILTVSGVVTTEADLAKIHALLSNAGMPIVDRTTIDQASLAKAQEEEARRKAEEANIRRLAQEEADKRAKEEEAKRLAEETEAKRLAKAEAEKKRKEEAEKLAKEKAAKKAEAEKLAKEKTADEYKKEQEIAKKNIIKLLQIQNIEFEVAKDSLTPRGKGTVDKLANILKQYPHIKVEIAGHTDSDGSATFNQNLSQSRVNTVQKRLISKGINGNRLTAKGYGESQPLVPNTSDENKQRNRRVEINIQGE